MGHTVPVGALVYPELCSATDVEAEAEGVRDDPDRVEPNPGRCVGHFATAGTPPVSCGMSSVLLGSCSFCGLAA